MKRIIIISLITIGLLLIGVFGVRAVKSFLHIRHIETEIGSPVSLHGWMTIPFIAKSHHIPVDYLFDAIGVPRAENEDESIHHLKNNYFDGNADAIIQAIQTAVAEYNPALDARPEQP